MWMTEEGKDIMTEAINFTSNLSEVLTLNECDQQSKLLLEKAKAIVEGLMAEIQKISSGSSMPYQAPSPSGIRKWWLKLKRSKPQNDNLKQQPGQSQDDKCSSPKDKDPKDIIISDLQKTKTENEVLKDLVMQLQISIHELQNSNRMLLGNYERTKVALDIAQPSMEKDCQDDKKLETRFCYAKPGKDSLKQNRITSSIKPMVKGDNQLTENISEQCQSTTVELHNNMLGSQQWVDAEEAIEESPNRGLDKCRGVSLLCQGLMSTYTAAEQLYNNMAAVLAELLKRPMLAETGTVPRQLDNNVVTVVAELLKRPTLATTIIENQLASTGQNPVLSDELADLLKQELHQNRENVCTDICLIATESQDLTIRNKLQQLSSNKAVNEYFKECARISWQMVVQSQPMHLVAEDTKFNDEAQGVVDM